MDSAGTRYSIGNLVRDISVVSGEACLSKRFKFDRSYVLILRETIQIDGFFKKVQLVQMSSSIIGEMKFQVFHGLL